MLRWLSNINEKARKKKEDVCAVYELRDKI